MRFLPLVLLAALVPGLASAQQGTLTPSQRCEQNYQTCVRNCFGGDQRSCMSNCDATRAHCIQNPSTATQPRR